MRVIHMFCSVGAKRPKKQVRTGGGLAALEAVASSPHSDTVRGGH